MNVNAPDKAPGETRSPSILDRALRTERLLLRPGTVDDTAATWAFRQLEEVNEWLTGTPPDLDGYRALFTDPERLATTVVIQLGHGPGGEVIGDLMLRREDAWAQHEVADRARGKQHPSAGSSIRAAPAAGTPPKPSGSCSAIASRTSTCAAWPRTASWPTTRRGA